MSAKEIRKPDQLLVTLKALFEEAFSKPKVVLGGLALLLVVGVSVAFYMEHQSSRNEAANDAFFSAQKTFITEVKAQAHPEDLSFQKLDVNTVFKQTVKQYADVATQFPRTRAGFEAQVALGSLYLQHGQAAEATPWFEKGLKAAPNSLEKAALLANLGYSFENQQKWKEALESYQKGLNQGEATWKSELLLGIARCLEQLKDINQARSTYDQITIQLPNTEAAHFAEARKAQLQP